MKLQDKGSTVVYDVPKAVGQKLVASGLATEVVDTPKPSQSHQELPKFADINRGFSAREGHRLGDYQYPPRICFGCPTCRQSGYVSNVTDKFVFRHCGRADAIPNPVREDYDRLVRAYRARSRNTDPFFDGFREPTGLVDSGVLDRALGKFFGVKSRAELIAEMTLANRKG
jgi:hypothetical protein